MPITSGEKKAVIKEFAHHAKDTGSAEVQIAIMTQKIASLTKHFQQFKKDNNSKRGLVRLIGRRKKLLRYLKQTSLERYSQLSSKLGIK